MTKEQIHIGAWVIWPGDTHPHPRQILRKEKDGAYILNIRHQGRGPYVEYTSPTLEINLLAARLCREDEIPEQFKIEGQLITYQIY